MASVIAMLFITGYSSRNDDIGISAEGMICYTDNYVFKISNIFIRKINKYTTVYFEYIEKTLQ